MKDHSLLIVMDMIPFDKDYAIWCIHATLELKGFKIKHMVIHEHDSSFNPVRPKEDYDRFDFINSIEDLNNCYIRIARVFQNQLLLLYCLKLNKYEVTLRVNG